MGERILERMHKLTLLDRSAIRVWAKAKDLRSNDEKLAQFDALNKAVNDVYLNRKPLVQEDMNEIRVQIAEEIAKLDFCNAVEVLDGMGDGGLIYPDWP